MTVRNDLYTEKRKNEYIMYMRKDMKIEERYMRRKERGGGIFVQKWKRKITTPPPRPSSNK